MAVFAAHILITLPIFAQTSSAAAIQRFIDAASEKGSDTLYVTVDGVPVIDWSRGEKRPIELMSAVKSVVAIAVGTLLHDGKLKSLDEPVHTLFPEWNQGRKKLITIRHLLNHTSGLQNVPNAGAEIYPSNDAIQLALAAELTSDPGAEFAYNNKAVNLLAGVIARASGLRMDLYIARELFAPLGIDEYQWYFDRSGTPHAMAGLRLHASDAAKFGQLVLNRGMYGSTRLVTEQFIDEMLAPGQSMFPGAGLLWWRYLPDQTIRLFDSLPALLHGSVVQEKLATLPENEFSTAREARQALQSHLGSDYDKLPQLLGGNWFNALFDWQPGSPAAYYAEGSLGQFIVVVPEARLVAVRQVARRPGLGSATVFSDFPAEAVAFARSLD